MRFARVVYLVAGVWGIAVLTPLSIVAFAMTPKQSGIFAHALRLSELSKRMRFPQRTVT